MIPLEFLFAVWLAATIVSCVAAHILIKRRRKSLVLTMIAVVGASLGMLTFYTANLFGDFRLQIMIAWSRWAISIMGLVILGSGIAAIILNKDRRQ